MDKIEDWKCRFLSTSCELKHLLGEVSGSYFPTDMIYSTLDNCKQLMEVAVETVCMSRFKIHSVELIHVNTLSNTVLRTTLDDILSSLWCSLQRTNSSSFDSVIDQMLSSGRLGPSKDFSRFQRHEKLIFSNDTSLKVTSNRNTGNCKVLDYGEDNALCVQNDQDESNDSEVLSCKEQCVLKVANESEVAVKLQEDDRVQIERLSNVTNECLPAEDSENYQSILSQFGVVQNVFPTENEENEVTDPSVHKISRDMMALRKGKQKISTVAKNCDAENQDQIKSLSFLKRRQTFVNKKGNKSSEHSTKVLRTPTLQGGKKVSHSINFLAYKCFLCEPPNCIYSSFKELASHISSVHAIPDGSGKRVLYCSRKSEGNCLWSKSFQNVMDRDQVAYSLTHLIFNHNMAVPEFVQPFHCPHPNCTYQAVRKFSIDGHLSTHEADLVPCKHCGKRLKKKSMHLHRMFCEVIGLKVKPNVCPVENCDKSFKSKYSLLNHIKANHENIKAHHCSSCEKSFVNKSDHACHMFACHGVNITGREVYSCPICNFSTVAKTVFHRHVMRVHPKLWQLVGTGQKTKGRGDKTKEQLEHAAVDLLRNQFRDLVNELEEETAEAQQNKETVTDLRDMQMQEKTSTFGVLQDTVKSRAEETSSTGEQVAIKYCYESNENEHETLGPKENTILRLPEKSNISAVVKIEDEDMVENEHPTNRLLREKPMEKPLEESQTFVSISSQSCVATSDVLQTGSDGKQGTDTDVGKISSNLEASRKGKRKMSTVAVNNDKPAPSYKKRQRSISKNDKSSEHSTKVLRAPTLQGGKKVSHSINFLAYKCFLCEPPNCIYSSFKELASHISSVHAIPDGSGKRVLYCSRKSEGNCLWSKSFQDVMDRDQIAYSLTHLIFNHNMAVPEFVQPFHCPHPNCTYQAVRKFSIDSHLSTHEADLVPCKHCGKKLKKRSMRLHRMFCEVIGLKVKPNVCPVENCDKSFKSKYSLLNHIKANHENIKAHHCSSCEKSFVNKSDHACHMFACHGVNITGREVYNCPICNFSTVAKTVFRRHVMKVHPKLWQMAGKDRQTRADKTQEDLENAAADLLKTLTRDLESKSQQEALETQPNKPTYTEMLIDLSDMQLEEEELVLCQEIETQVPKLSDCEENFTVLGIKTEQSFPVGADKNQRNSRPENTESKQMMNVDSREIQMNVAQTDVMLNGTNSSETEEEDEEEGQSMKVKSSSHTMNFTRLQCFLCPSTDVVFQSITLLFSHIKDAHSVAEDNDRRVLKCPECCMKKLFKRHGIDRDLLARLLNHLIVKHKWNVPEFVVPYYCSHPGCGFFSIQQRNLTAHLRRHTEQEKVPCDKCGKFLNPMSFREHSTSCSVSVEERRVFHCNQCDKTFTKKQGLENHIRIKHENIKNFLCSHCTMRFGSGRELEEHAFNLHRINPRNKPVLSCPQCPFVTIKMARFEKHCKYVHVKVREHTCPVCNKRFKTTGQLRNHMQGHNEKSFRCQLCDFCTARKQNLQEHIQAQHIRKQFKCEFCDYVTGYMANLHKHLRITCRKKQHMLQKAE